MGRPDSEMILVLLAKLKQKSAMTSGLLSFSPPATYVGR